MTPTPPLVECLIEDPRWDGAGLPDWAEHAARTALTALGLDPADYEISLLGCDDERIARLNAEFRGKAAPTNVLSWPARDRVPDRPGQAPPAPPAGSSGAPVALGDLAMAFDTCLREARDAGLGLELHGRHLVVHGVLHLLGYDHESDADADLMEGLEVGILAQMGVADPYAHAAGVAPAVTADVSDG